MKQMSETNQLPFLHLGCGKIILPGPRPAHHGIVDEAIYSYPLYWNVDRNWSEGVDECVDLFTYPWPWPSESYDGALLTHLLEHVPHEIKLADEPTARSGFSGQEWADRREELKQCQDGYFCFMSELWRVLTHGARAYILSPFAFSSGAMSDPSHTRYITEQTFKHSIAPNPDSPFNYDTGGMHFELVDDAVRYGITKEFQHLTDNPHRLHHALGTRINVASEICAILEAVKPDESDSG